MTKYRLTCKKCDMNHTHQTDKIEGILDFWKNWNKKYSENMKCVHDYVIETLE